ncbi:AAA-domain-containing protein, protein [Acrodontium crateriforme]|uniref:AAA-domain-containing protein, protein n=1 Tax=Acrodontium crateriforme TaxID=150365 RepID=A0AAQ3MAM0_9PEZI|nr:AAA-domain-containing protein, protein [Acrodontium crateriforme]
MRSITRQSIRLAPSNRVRQSSASRCRCGIAQVPQTTTSNSLALPSATTSQPRRYFHGSTVQFESSGTPREPPESSNNSADARLAEERRKANAETSADATTNNETARPTSAFAQRNLKSNSTSIPLRNKTLRQRRAAETRPSPPPIPEWFLDNNVKLLTDEQFNGLGEISEREKHGQVIRCLDTQTGEVLFTMPGYPYYSNATETGTFDVPIEDETAAQSTENATNWADLELELGVLGALSLESHNQSSHAASRVDLSLVSSGPDTHGELESRIESIAIAVGADVVELDSTDIEELAGEYVGQGQDLPGSFSTLSYDVFEGYTGSASGGFKQPITRYEDEGMDEDDMNESEPADEDAELPTNAGEFGSMSDLRKALHARRHDLAKALEGTGIAGFSIGVPKVIHAGSLMQLGGKGSVKSSSPADYVSWDDARLVALLESVLDSPLQKKNQEQSSPSKEYHSQEASTHPSRNRRQWYNKSSSLILGDLAHAIRIFKTGQTPLFEFQSAPRGSTRIDGLVPEQKPRTIIHIKDLKDICRSRLGETIIKRLVRVVQKRRRSGQAIMIIGTSCDTAAFGSFASETDDFPFRSMTYLPAQKSKERSGEALPISSVLVPNIKNPKLFEPSAKILKMNLVHIQSMVKRLIPGSRIDMIGKAGHVRQLDSGVVYHLQAKVLDYDAVQRIALTAVGLAHSCAASDNITALHVGIAVSLMARQKQLAREWSKWEEKTAEADAVAKMRESSKNKDQQNAAEKQAIRLDKIRKSCNTHETRLLSGVVDAENIKTGFAEVHAPTSTIEALKTLTTLSLLRPDAFKYGVLANDRLTGLLLYGPPGTGKTLLAKAVAKESAATVLEVSGAQIYEKYVGEGEKMVRAVFSLAKKLSPCIVFIDEADALFTARTSGGGSRNTHREIINQFLREWDGMDDNGVFMMVATNRPFDLDDAVLRRLPRRLLVDLPVAKDRESILGIHLKGEQLDERVKLEELAQQTPLYSGSDLKNLCVAAALAAVREENDLVAKATAETLAQQKQTPEQKSEESSPADIETSTPSEPASSNTYKLPPRRTLAPHHFTTAMAEISASISEDMASLTAIRKFDEQYGDRRGRRQKTGLGFGSIEREASNEDAARVRQDISEPSAPPSAPRAP